MVRVLQGVVSTLAVSVLESLFLGCVDLKGFSIANDGIPFCIFAPLVGIVGLLTC